MRDYEDTKCVNFDVGAVVTFIVWLVLFIMGIAICDEFKLKYLFHLLWLVVPGLLLFCHYVCEADEKQQKQRKDNEKLLDDLWQTVYPNFNRVRHEKYMTSEMSYLMSLIADLKKRRSASNDSHLKAEAALTISGLIDEVQKIIDQQKELEERAFEQVIKNARRNIL